MMTNQERSRPRVRLPLGKRRLAGVFWSLALSLSTAIVLLVQAPVARLEGPNVYAIRGAQIVTGTGRTLSRGTVVFRDGLITDVGDNAKIPADARVIDGTGLIVYPGLIDGFTSLALPAPARSAGGGPGGVAVVVAQQAAQPSQSLGDPTILAADLVRPDGAGLEDARNAGLTAALTSPRQGIFAGQSALINLAGADASKLVLRTPVALTVQFTTTSGFLGEFPNSLMGTVSFIRQSFYDAQHYRDELDRFNRVKRGVPRPEYDRKLAALQPALRGSLPVLFIANSEGDIRRALMISDEFKLKPIIAGASFSYRVADMLKSRNVPVILSVDFPKRPADQPADVPDSLRVLRQRAEIPAGAAQLERAGVKFAFMSGSLRPQEFLGNVQRAVERGLPKEAAIRALTKNAAEIFDVDDQLGTIETGKIANLVVTSGDLLARETRVRHVFIDGREIDLRRPEPSAGAAQGRPGAQPGAQPAASAVDPTGEWSLVVTTPQGDQNVTLNLRREGQQIVGTLAGPMGTYPVRNVQVAGSELRFSVSIQISSDTIDASVTGNIEGNSMRGVFTLPALGSFNFTGTKPQ